MGSNTTTGTCTTCNRPAFPHPYRHPVTIAATAADAPARELTDRERLAALASELMIARLDADTERTRADQWREHGSKFYDLREWLRLCEDTPAGHTEFYRWAAHIIFPGQHPAPADADDTPPETTDLGWLDELLNGICESEPDTDDGWWETSTGAEFGRRKLDELKREITHRYHTTNIRLTAPEQQRVIRRQSATSTGKPAELRWVEPVIARTAYSEGAE